MSSRLLCASACGAVVAPSRPWHDGRRSRRKTGRDDDGGGSGGDDDDGEVQVAADGSREESLTWCLSNGGGRRRRPGEADDGNGYGRVKHSECSGAFDDEATLLPWWEGSESV